MTDVQDIPEDDALAAEYVLRLLDAEEERAFDARLLSDPHLRAQVQFWEAEFAPLAQAEPDVPPPSSVKAQVLSALDGKAPEKRGLLAWLKSWNMLLGSATAAVALVAFFAFAPILRAPAFDPAYHATLISQDGVLHIEAGYAPDGNLFKVIHETGNPEPGRDFELWVIGEGAPAPVSLGVIEAGKENTFEISPAIAALIKGGQLAVSDEPEGGSPTGAPTGAVLAVDAFFDV